MSLVGKWMFLVLWSLVPALAVEKGGLRTNFPEPIETEIFRSSQANHDWADKVRSPNPVCFISTGYHGELADLMRWLSYAHCLYPKSHQPVRA